MSREISSGPTLLSREEKSGVRVECTCRAEGCGKTFYRYPSQIANGSGLYCCNDHRIATQKAAWAAKRGTCDICGKPLRSQAGEKYCSRKCQGIAQRGKIDRVCSLPGCKKHFFVIPAVVANGGGKFCCRAHWYQFSKGRPRPSGRLVQRVCALDGCENQFEVAPSILELGRGKFCSLECYRESRGHPIEVRCQRAECGRVFTVVPSSLRTKRRLHCSRECLAADRAAHKTAVACANCGNELSVSLKRQRQRKHIFCSQPCFWAYQRRTTQRVACALPECGNTFVMSRGSSRRYCGHSCAQIGNLRDRKLRTHSERPTCLRCGKVLDKPPWRNAKYCESGCVIRKGRTRNTDDVERNKRIWELQCEGRKAPEIRWLLIAGEDGEKKLGWLLSEEAIRKVISREKQTRALAGAAL
jgi:hypothetical protein